MMSISNYLCIVMDKSAAVICRYACRGGNREPCLICCKVTSRRPGSQCWGHNVGAQCISHQRKLEDQLVLTKSPQATTINITLACCGNKNK